MQAAVGEHRFEIIVIATSAKEVPAEPHERIATLKRELKG